MQVTINQDKIQDGFSERIITVDINEFNEITLALQYRLEALEERLEDYRNSDFEQLKELIPRTEMKIKRLKDIIKSLG